MDLGTASRYRQELLKLNKDFNQIAEDYIIFLQAHRTSESESARASFQLTLSVVTARISVALKHLNTLLPDEKFETVSIRSKSRASDRSKSELLR